MASKANEGFPAAEQSKEFHKGKEEVTFELVLEEESFRWREAFSRRASGSAAAQILVLALFLPGLMFMNSPPSLSFPIFSGDICIYLSECKAWYGISAQEADTCMKAQGQENAGAGTGVVWEGQ